MARLLAQADVSEVVDVAAEVLPEAAAPVAQQGAQAAAQQAPGGIPVVAADGSIQGIVSPEELVAAVSQNLQVVNQQAAQANSFQLSDMATMPYWSDLFSDIFTNLAFQGVLLLQGIIVSVVLLAIGFFVATIVASIVRYICGVLRIDKLAKHTPFLNNLMEANPVLRPSIILSKLVRWSIIIMFLLNAMVQLRLTTLAQFVGQILVFLPNLIVALIILGVGFMAGDFVKKMVSATSEAGGMQGGDQSVLASIAHWALVAFAGFAAMAQLGIASDLVNIVVAGVVFSASLAIGLGSKDRVTDMLKKLG